MTVEERLEALEVKFGKIDKIVGDQNSYITNLEARKKQLEAEVKAAPAVQPVAQPVVQPVRQPAQPVAPKATTPINKPYEEFQRKQWRKAVVNETLASITNVRPEHKTIMEKEVRDYCDKQMTDANTTDKFVRAVFEMLYGRALINPAHEIHKAVVVQAANPAQPVQPVAQQPEQPAQPQPSIPSLAGDMAQAFPPVVGQTAEQTFNPAAPQPEVQTGPKSVAEAMAILKQDL